MVSRAMAEHWSWLTGAGAEYTYSPPSRPSRPPHRPLVKLATSARLSTIARAIVVSSVGMASGWLWLVFGVILGSVLDPAQGDAEVMSHVTAHFGKALEECREESGLSADVMEGFQHFWSEDFEVVHRELGCAIICMSNKFSLMQDDARMHHVNMHDYVKSFPKGEILSAKMVELIHNCEKQYDDIEEDCSRVVKVAACFKRDAKKEGIAPEVTMIEAVMEKY